MRELSRSSGEDSNQQTLPEHINCPRCGDRWYEDLDEEGRPFTCFFCCNGTVKITHEMIDEYIGGRDLDIRGFYNEK